MIIFTTEPNNNQFQTKVLLKESNKFEIFENEIERISLYGKTANCIKNEYLKNFCYCI